jgi:nucleoid DNA-binding protein
MKFIKEKTEKECLEFICDQTGLTVEIVTLLIEAFVFFIKKDLYENGEIKLRHFGTFSLIHQGRRNIIRKSDGKLMVYNKRKVIIKFSPCDYFKERIKGKRQQERKITQLNFERVKNLEKISQMFGLNILDTRHIYCLYLTSIGMFLKKNKQFVVKKFGVFSLKSFNWFKKSVIAVKWNCEVENINLNKIYLFMVKTSDHELNNKQKQFVISRRLRRMFFFAGINRDIIIKVPNDF